MLIYQLLTEVINNLLSSYLFLKIIIPASGQSSFQHKN